MVRLQAIMDRAAAHDLSLSRVSLICRLQELFFCNNFLQEKILDTLRDHVFDRQAVCRHKDRAAEALPSFDFLLREAAERLADRLLDIRKDFPLALELTTHGRVLRDAIRLGGPSRTAEFCSSINVLLHAQMAPAMLVGAGPLQLVADEEYLPIKNSCLDLIVSSCGLHWANDLPGVLIQSRQALKPDGLLLVNFFGGNTLTELRRSLLQAEMEVEGGAGIRVSPFADIRDAGALLQRANFALPVADTETITVSYDSPLKLFRDLRGMGETNAVIGRRKSFSRRRTLMRACEIYESEHADESGRVPATFELITLTGWAPARGQPKSAPRGSGQVSLTGVLGASEVSPKI